MTIFGFLAVVVVCADVWIVTAIWLRNRQQERTSAAQAREMQALAASEQHARELQNAEGLAATVAALTERVDKTERQVRALQNQTELRKARR